MWRLRGQFLVDGVLELCESLAVVLAAAEDSTPDLRLRAELTERGKLEDARIFDIDDAMVGLTGCVASRLDTPSAPIHR